VLQGVAGCCRVLQGVAGCCRVLQGVAMCLCSVAHAARNISSGQQVCVAVCCSILVCGGAAAA